MGKHAPLTTCFHDIQNRIDDAMFAMNTFSPQGAKRLKKETFSNKEVEVKLVPDLIRERQSLCEQLKDGFALFSGSGNSSPHPRG